MSDTLCLIRSRPTSVWHVEDDGKIGDHFTYGEPIDLGDRIVGNLSGHALIYGSGVKEAVAKNDLALAYRWHDDFTHQLGPACGEKQQLGFGKML